MKVINTKGIQIHKGIGIGDIFIKKELPKINTIKIDDFTKEINRFSNKVEEVKLDLENLYENKRKNLGEDKARIFKAHLMILQDPEYFKKITQVIKKEKINAEAAVKKITDEFIEKFQKMDNKYLKQRSVDIQDVGNRILRKLKLISQDPMRNLKKDIILIAKELTPSDTAQLDPKYVKGIITESGGYTSHSAIISRTYEIPSIMGQKGICSNLKENENAIFDVYEEKIILNPTNKVKNQYEIKQKEIIKEKKMLKKMIGRETKTIDGKKIELSTNIASLKDVNKALENDSEGIGLFRSEFIYMDKNNLPSEKEQFNIYKKVLEKFNDKPVIIRTLDIGGDKDVSYLEFKKEMNPFLGKRAIRYCFEEIEIFKTQLRALYKASKYGNLKIMFPMISSVLEIKRVKKILKEVKKELLEENISFDKNIEIGIMIEIPSAAIMSDKLAKEVDFFSIGTNDLIQYTTASDRMNPDLKDIYTPYNPGVLRLINMIIKNAHEEGIWVEMCGSAAGDQNLIPLLVGMGIDELSMSSSFTLKSRELIRNLNQNKLQKTVKKVLNAKDKKRVKAILKNNK